MKYPITILFLFLLYFKASAQVDDRDFKIVPIKDSLIADTAVEVYLVVNSDCDS